MSELPRASTLRRWWWRAATWQRLLSTTGGTLATVALISAAGSLPVLPTEQPDPLAGGVVQPLGTSSAITPSITAPPIAGRTPAWPSRVLTVTKVLDARTITGTDESGAPVTVQVVGTPQPGAQPGCAAGDAARFAEKELLGKKVGLLDLREENSRPAARVFTAGHEYATLLADWLAACQRAGTTSTAAPSSSSTAAVPPPTAAPPPSSTPAPTSTADAPFYKNCAQVRKAGKAPLLRDQPGYRPELDKDGDGVACDR
ncbi:MULTISPECIES: excalibur calcium-binding domain-containing protein [unclassified Crossiella]|uniref:excalibur calcium-binding domain-containing protein n=1 Tax=unclassified Crossiella TaxID=2620835 RepID=UPI001FFFC320|nr:MULTISPECIES: excalibur calcium-binding domain-containing protein [unclassified Crossiella]MCK2237756.1 excalibur calcium-binding domain-containing protein [Crossiella sp. S99.2]MCK2255042.1 excalibur calcium-binding domain-containing protein [Crossiella sp. S99.1]